MIYGDKQTPELIALDYNDLWKQYIKGHFTSTVIASSMSPAPSIRVIPRDMQVDPIMDRPIHVDFLRIGKDARASASPSRSSSSTKRCRPA